MSQLEKGTMDFKEKEGYIKGTKQRVKSPVPPNPTLSYTLFDAGNRGVTDWGNGTTRRGFIPLSLSDLHSPSNSNFLLLEQKQDMYLSESNKRNQKGKT